MPELAVVPSRALSPLVGPKILLEGPGGTGKTYALRTLVDAGITPFVVALEPGIEVVGDVPSAKLHWSMIKPHVADWQTAIESAERINSLSYETLTKMQDPNKHQYTRWIDILRSLSNFKCDRTGEAFGGIETWGTNRAIIIDNFSEFCQASLELNTGGKIVRNMPEWQVAQNNVENLLRMIILKTRCWFIMIAHIDRITDEVLGGSRIMTLSLGKALSPKLPQLFSDVILTQREGKKFTWSTAAIGVDLKSRNTPIADNLPPSFAPVVAEWQKHGGIIEGDALA